MWAPWHAPQGLRIPSLPETMEEGLISAVNAPTDAASLAPGNFTMQVALTPSGDSGRMPTTVESLRVWIEAALPPVSSDFSGATGTSVKTLLVDFMQRGGLGHVVDGDSFHKFLHRYSFARLRLQPVMKVSALVCERWRVALCCHQVLTVDSPSAGPMLLLPLR